jgi:hypothetical protein
VEQVQALVTHVEHPCQFYGQTMALEEVDRMAVITELSTAAHWSPAANRWQPSPECGELSLLSELKNTIFQNKMESL